MVTTATAKHRLIYSFLRLGYRNIYFRLSGFQSSLLPFYFRYGRITCSHGVDEEWQKHMRRVVLYFQDRRDKASLCYRKRAVFLFPPPLASCARMN